jgi:hypothetical protein
LRRTIGTWRRTDQIAHKTSKSRANLREPVAAKWVGTLETRRRVAASFGTCARHTCQLSLYDHANLFAHAHAHTHAHLVMLDIVDEQRVSQRHAETHGARRQRDVERAQLGDGCCHEGFGDKHDMAQRACVLVRTTRPHMRVTQCVPGVRCISRSATVFVDYARAHTRAHHDRYAHPQARRSGHAHTPQL